MSNRVFAGFLGAFAISVILSDAPAGATCSKAQKCAGTSAKHAKKVQVAAATHRRHSGHVGRNGLIPPPPAYMPCILPELYYHNNTATGITEVAVEKKENPYVQYVKTPSGDAPEALQSRKGVVTWHKRS